MALLARGGIPAVKFARIWFPNPFADAKTAHEMRATALKDWAGLSPRALRRELSMSVMAGLVPAIPLRQHSAMAEYYVYILASRPGGAIYVGVTNNLIRRVYEHKAGAVDGFAKQYNIKRLVYFEAYPDVRNALQREKNMKHWPRAWKTRLIVRDNPTWRDLYDEIAV